MYDVYITKPKKAMNHNNVQCFKFQLSTADWSSRHHMCIDGLSWLTTIETIAPYSLPATIFLRDVYIVTNKLFQVKKRKYLSD